MNGTPPDASTKGDERRPAATGKGIPPRVLWIGGTALGAVLAVFIAWQAGRYESRATSERLAGELREADARLNALEARRLLHRAILELEARNFGSAQAYVDRAKHFLAASKDGVEDSPATELLTRLEAFRTNVDPNVGKQAAQLVQIARDLDERVPEPELPHGVDATDSAPAEADPPNQAPPGAPGSTE